MLVFSWHIWCFSVCIWGLCRKKEKLKEGILNSERGSLSQRKFRINCVSVFPRNNFLEHCLKSQVMSFYTNKPRLILLRSSLCRSVVTFLDCQILAKCQSVWIPDSGRKADHVFSVCLMTTVCLLSHCSMTSWVPTSFSKVKDGDN